MVWNARAVLYTGSVKTPDNLVWVSFLWVRHRKPEDAMKNFAKKVQRFLVSEDGPTAVEYAVMLALIVIVCLTAIRSVGTNANATFTSVAGQLGS
jgi:pilus assembly protein Flp/PilA